MSDTHTLQRTRETEVSGGDTSGEDPRWDVGAQQKSYRDRDNRTQSWTQNRDWDRMNDTEAGGG